MFQREAYISHLKAGTRRRVIAGLTLLVGVLSISAASGASERCGSDTIPLPDGWQPEGVAAGPRGTIYAGSISTGAVYQARVKSGRGQILVPGQEGRSAIGLEWDSRTGLLYVAGGATGQVFIYDGRTGADVAVLTAASPETSFVNDVVVTNDAVYFTDSFQPQIFAIPLSETGALPDTPVIETIPITGDFEQVPDQLNANGIEATPDGRRLILVNSYLGALYSVDPVSGQAVEIDLQGDTTAFGDGLLRIGNRLFVVQNYLNRLAEVKLGLLAPVGSVVRYIENDGFDIPTTAARIGGALYVVNARFETEPTPETEYWITRVSLKP